MESPSTPGQAAQANGIEMYYETRGRGEPLVLLHGGGGVGDNWRLVFAETPEGFRLIAPDMRGHGPVFGDDAARFAETSLAFLRGRWEDGPR